LGSQAPLQAYPDAVHSGRHYRPEWEAELLNLNRVYQYLATCCWFRLVKADSCLTLGGIDYDIGKPLRGQALEVRFDPQYTVFLANVIGTNKTIALPPQGITVPELIGELHHFLALPTY
jgi:hypothetical protein